jgi:hypothetical protein
VRILSALALAAIGLLSAQTPQATALVRGKITNAKTGAPLEGVQLKMGVVGHGMVADSARSDANGNYEIRTAPGLYSIFVVRDGFVSGHYIDVANLPVLELGADQEAAADFHMVPGATIAGTVTDANGAPIPQAIIQGMAKVYRQGQIEWQLRTAGRTNDRGEYRLTDLPAGGYYLQAGKPGIASANTRTFVTLGYPRAARIEDAQPIRVAAGETRSVIDFRLPDPGKHSVSGRVLFPGTGKPVANILITAAPAYPDYGANTSVHSDADGNFRLEGLIDGHYRMEGLLMEGDESGIGGIRFIRFIEVRGSDVTNLAFRVGGTKVTGTLKASDGGLPGRVNVELVSRSPFGTTGNREAQGPVRYGADGAFEFIDVQPGIYDVKVIASSPKAAPKPEFFVQSVTVEEQDVSDSGITVPEGLVSLNVSVAVDFSPGTITGKTLDAQNRPLPGANLVLMSADTGKRLLEPYWRQLRSDPEGTFRLGSLVPGDYLLIMWPGYRPWDGLDPEEFAILEKHAVRVTVKGAGIVSRNLKLSPEEVQ